MDMQKIRRKNERSVEKSGEYAVGIGCGYIHVKIGDEGDHGDSALHVTDRKVTRDNQGEKEEPGAAGIKKTVSGGRQVELHWRVVLSERTLGARL
jgi:hypothetical protein